MLNRQKCVAKIKKYKKSEKIWRGNFLKFAEIRGKIRNFKTFTDPFRN